jgi:hypothetical protein
VNESRYARVSSWAEVRGLFAVAGGQARR